MTTTENVEEQKPKLSRIERLEMELAKAKKLEKLKDARIKAAASKKFRASETRRKILMGSFVLAQLDKNGINAMQMTYESARFSEWLTRDDDKELFEVKA